MKKLIRTLVIYTIIAAILTAVGYYFFSSETHSIAQRISAGLLLASIILILWGVFTMWGGFRLSERGFVKAKEVSSIGIYNSADEVNRMYGPKANKAVPKYNSALDIAAHLVPIFLGIVCLVLDIFL